MRAAVSHAKPKTTTARIVSLTDELSKCRFKRRFRMKSMLMTPNENKISYSGARRGSCVRSKARGVTRGAFSCIAWLGVGVEAAGAVEAVVVERAKCWERRGAEWGGGVEQG